VLPWVVGGAAAVAAGIATGLAISSSADAQRLLDSAQSHGQAGPPYPLLPDEVPIEKARASKAIGAGIAGGLAGAAAITAAILFFTQAQVQPAVAMTPEGATVVVSGQF
jgi:F0F1-type ATP synthase membrane subunit c/vacuolar-type H+-ATPase subunit K